VCVRVRVFLIFGRAHTQHRELWGANDCRLSGLSGLFRKRALPEKWLHYLRMGQRDEVRVGAAHRMSTQEVNSTPESTGHFIDGLAMPSRALVSGRTFAEGKRISLQGESRLLQYSHVLSPESVCHSTAPSTSSSTTPPQTTLPLPAHVLIHLMFYTYSDTREYVHIFNSSHDISGSIDHHTRVC